MKYTFPSITKTSVCYSLHEFRDSRAYIEKPYVEKLKNKNNK